MALTGSENRSARVPKASDVLADDIRRLILGQRMPEGTPLPPESELVEQFDFSRATVREALRLLEEDGLISVRRGPRGGIRVRHPDAAHVSRSITLMLGLTDAPLSQLIEFRKLVEPPIAELAATHATPEQRDALLALAEHAHDSGGHIDFHVLLAESCGNAVLGVLVAASYELVRFHIAMEQLTEPDLDAATGAHVKVARAVADGDGPGAGRAMRRHLAGFEALMADLERLDEPIVPISHWDTQRRAGSMLAEFVRTRAQAQRVSS